MLQVYHSLVYRLPEALAVDRFDEVINGINIKSICRIFFICSSENNGFAYSFCQVYTIHTRHLDIYKADLKIFLVLIFEGLQRIVIDTGNLQHGCFHTQHLQVMQSR
ncbi:hypothetical protein D3C86_1725910 [compost metagenome]